MMGDKATLEAIETHTHFQIELSEEGIIEWARIVAKTTAKMIADWMRLDLSME